MSGTVLRPFFARYVRFRIRLCVPIRTMIEKTSAPSSGTETDTETGTGPRLCGLRTEATRYCRTATYSWIP
jgi:hypothetical protein